MNNPVLLNAYVLDSEEQSNSNNNLGNMDKMKTHLPDPPSVYDNNKLKTKKDSHMNDLKQIINGIHESETSQQDSSGGLGDYSAPDLKSKKQSPSMQNTVVSASVDDAYGLQYNPAMIKNVSPRSSQHVMPNPYQNDVNEKLNYLIYLLEQQRDVKGNQTVEELLLYSFLGVFIIYVLDSFAKIGKYKR